LIIGAIVGPTGSGKSEFAFQVAEFMSASLVSLDSRQIYRGFRIGTAQEQPRQSVDLHLSGFLDPHQEFSVADYLQCVQEYTQSPKPCVLVGGTGHYLSSLMDGLPQVNISADVSTKVSAHAESGGLQELLRQLEKQDPEAVSQIDRQNPRRVQRALELVLSAGKPLAEVHAMRTGGIGSIPVVVFMPDREWLYQRINSRVLSMLEMGWVAEAQDLYKHYPDLSLPAWASIGYRELAQCEPDGPSEAIIAGIQQTTRRYAKRQLTYFRNQFEGVLVMQANPAEQLPPIQKVSEFFRYSR